MAERSVLHVLPHPGGGGETYVDLLSPMPAYRFSRIFLAPSPKPTPTQLARGVIEAMRCARRHDLLHVHGEVASGLCLPLLAARASIVTLHGLSLVRRLGGPRRAAAVLNLRAFVRTADRTICVSHAEHDNVARIAGSAAMHRADVVRCGVRLPPHGSEFDRAAVREEFGIAATDAVGIWIGSLDTNKNPCVAIRAAKRASVTLLVVGDGPLRSQVERVVGGRVRALGQRADVPRLLAGADFFLLTSGREGLSLSLLEAMAHGLPAVVSDLAENLEAIGDTGVAVPLGDEGALAVALRRLADDADERVILGRRARQRVGELFDAERMIAETRAIYDEVLASR